MTSFNKIFSVILTAILLVSPVTTLAQYGGTTTTIGINNPTINPTNSSSPKFSANNTGDSVNINIESAKKGSILDVKIGNSVSGVFKIKFTLGVDATNARVTINKLENNQLAPNFPGAFLIGFSVSLNNLNYDQITNFSFSFKVKRDTTQGKSLTAFSSSSPWIPASLSSESDSNIGSDELGYVGSSAVAFRQFGISTSAPSTLNPSQNSTNEVNLTRTEAGDLVRTGGLDTIKILSITIALIILAGLSFVLVRSNQNRR